jgi:diguanylate cyclase (GGDEF)-like protein
MNNGTNTSGQAPTLLVVDDEVNILRAVERLMTGSQMRVLSFNDPAAALSCLADPSIVVIVSDFRMPMFQGTDLLAQAQKDNRFARRILLSAFTDVARERIAVARIHHVISKPYEPFSLRATILQSAVDALFETLMSRLPSLLRSLQTCTLGSQVRALLSEGLGVLGAEISSSSLEPGEVRRNAWGQALHLASQFPDRENSVIELLLNAASFAIDRLSGASEPNLDPVTTLPSSHVFATALARERERAVRYKTPLCIALLDVHREIESGSDPEYNPTAIPTVAQIIQRNIRNIDVASRIQGCRFSLLFPGIASRSAVLVMKRITNLIAAWAVSSDGCEDLVSSVGIAHSSAEETGSEPFIARAESALEYSLRHAPNGITVQDKNAITTC